MINKVKKIIKILKLEAHVKKPQKHLFLHLGAFVWKYVWLQYHKSLPTFILCQWSLCLIFRSEGQLELKLLHKNNCVYKQLQWQAHNIIVQQLVDQLNGLQSDMFYITFHGNIKMWSLNTGLINIWYALWREIKIKAK